jgi:hypothetical protein
MKRVVLSIAVAVTVLAIMFCTYRLWTPGEVITDGRHDRRSNCIWIQHGWIGDDGWFVRHRRQARLPYFRNADEVRKLAQLLRRHGITDVFPHLCPASPDGAVPLVDAVQTRRFLAEFQGVRGMPWVGGVSGVHVFEQGGKWRRRFAASVRGLLDRHPLFAGILLNVEPCASGNQEFLHVLEEVRTALPVDKILSVAPYPPPTLLQPFPGVHWDREYYQEVAKLVDQIAVMMYDTGLPLQRVYQWQLASWTNEVLAWGTTKEVLLGLPAYGDPGVKYHDPQVENLWNAFRGIHAGLSRRGVLPDNYRGMALYSEWEMKERDWKTMAGLFEKTDAQLTCPPKTEDLIV